MGIKNRSRREKMIIIRENQTAIIAH